MSKHDALGQAYALQDIAFDSVVAFLDGCCADPEQFLSDCVIDPPIAGKPINGQATQNHKSLRQALSDARQRNIAAGRPTLNAEQLAAIGTGLRSWSTVDERVRIRTGKPLPGTLKPQAPAKDNRRSQFIDDILSATKQPTSKDQPDEPAS